MKSSASELALETSEGLKRKWSNVKLAHDKVMIKFCFTFKYRFLNLSHFVFYWYSYLRLSRLFCLVPTSPNNRLSTVYFVRCRKSAPCAEIQISGMILTSHAIECSSSSLNSIAKTTSIYKKKYFMNWAKSNSHAKKGIRTQWSSI